MIDAASEQSLLDLDLRKVTFILDESQILETEELCQ